MKVFVVYLRRPSRLDDARWDPFWEKGSFGRTGCHSRNLLSPNCRIMPRDSYVLFLQGGDDCIRAVALVEVSGVTPFVLPGSASARRREGRELRWDPKLGIFGPFLFEEAPLLIDNDGRTDFKRFKRTQLPPSDCKSLVSGAASRFRARAEPLDDLVAVEVVRVMASCQAPVARAFHEAIPDGAWRERRSANQEAELAARLDQYAKLCGASPVRTCR